MSGYKNTLGYLCNHGMMSSYHKLSMEGAYAQVVAKWNELDWVIEEDTFESREMYRQHVDGKRDQGSEGLQAQAKGAPGAKRQKSSAFHGELEQMQKQPGQTNAAVQSLLDHLKWCSEQMNTSSGAVASGQMNTSSGAAGSDSSAMVPVGGVRNSTKAQAVLTMAILR